MAITTPGTHSPLRRRSAFTTLGKTQLDRNLYAHFTDEEIEV